MGTTDSLVNPVNVIQVGTVLPNMGNARTFAAGVFCDVRGGATGFGLALPKKHLFEQSLLCSMLSGCLAGTVPIFLSFQITRAITPVFHISVDPYLVVCLTLFVCMLSVLTTIIFSRTSLRAVLCNALIMGSALGALLALMS